MVAVTTSLPNPPAPSVGRVIETDACVSEGAQFLVQIEPRFAAALDQTGPLPLRRRPEGFAELLAAIVGQQVSLASASAILARLAAAGWTDPERALLATEDDLRACGLSKQKIRYTQALAAARLDYPVLRTLPDAEVMRRLTEISGIGRWTAEIYAMFSLGRADVFAANDLALQEAARILFDLPARPKEREMRAMAEAWSPWQAVAARILWSYYRVAKNREGSR